jgi:hypothetical protein
VRDGVFHGTTNNTTSVGSFVYYLRVVSKDRPEGQVRNYYPAAVDPDVEFPLLPGLVGGRISLTWMLISHFV